MGASEHQIETSILSSAGNRELNMIQQEGAFREHSLPEESKANVNRSNFFGAIKQFISEKVWSENGKYEPVAVTDPEFWPHIIKQCGQDWRSLAHQPGIIRLMHSFDPKIMNFTEEVPSDPIEL